MIKYALYSKNNQSEPITIKEESNIGLASLYFRMQKQLSKEEFDKLFEVKKV